MHYACLAMADLVLHNLAKRSPTDSSHGVDKLPVDGYRTLDRPWASLAALVTALCIDFEIFIHQSISIYERSMYSNGILGTGGGVHGRAKLYVVNHFLIRHSALSCSP